MRASVISMTRSLNVGVRGAGCDGAACAFPPTGPILGSLGLNWADAGAAASAVSKASIAVWRTHGLIRTASGNWPTPLVGARIWVGFDWTGIYPAGPARPGERRATVSSYGGILTPPCRPGTFS